MSATALSGGFADVPIEAAHSFRALLRVLSCPGQIATVSGAQPPAPASPAAGAALLTLCDPETPLHLAGDHDTPDLRAWVTFHTGAPLVSAERAQFALGTWDALQPLSVFPLGTSEYPDRSATLIVEVPHLAAEGATLRGPGIEHTAQLNLPETAAFQANRRHFPMGLDFYFTAGAQIAGLPRSTHVEA